MLTKTSTTSNTSCPIDNDTTWNSRCLWKVCPKSSTDFKPEWSQTQKKLNSSFQTDMKTLIFYKQSSSYRVCYAAEFLSKSLQILFSFNATFYRRVFLLQSYKWLTSFKFYSKLNTLSNIDLTALQKAETSRGIFIVSFYKFRMHSPYLGTIHGMAALTIGKDKSETFNLFLIYLIIMKLFTENLWKTCKWSLQTDYLNTLHIAIRNYDPTATLWLPDALKLIIF